ncbi:hypothetical protein VTO42DRAFT_267 [Malbranchea cinnamomea]
MAAGDLVNFDIIESQKENIQSIPSGRSARALAASLSPLAEKSGSPSLNDTNTVNNAIRAEFEQELQSIAESDDPLDIYDRYVKWTLDAYPSAQATPQSGLLPLLERATKAFLSSKHYKNDPRYLRLWLHYIRLFSDAPRETFAFLARHGIGDGLALFYEEFAAWLEGVGRYTQAEEVYQLGLQREARPTERLLRKYKEFQARLEERPAESNGPSSPALPAVRPALAAKVDPFASARAASDPQPASTRRGFGGGSTTRSGKPKMAIFSDADGAGPEPTPMGGSQTKGWETIGSLRERSKENTIEPRPWAGETLKVAKKASTGEKLTVFRDKFSPSLSREPKPIESTVDHNWRETVNSRTGRVERVYVDLKALYPDPNNLKYEMSLEELRAIRRGWMDRERIMQLRRQPLKERSIPCRVSPKFTTAIQKEHVNKSLSEKFNEKLLVDDETRPNKENEVETVRELKAEKGKKMKFREIRCETQTIKMNFDSPTGGKLKKKRKSSADPTMTFHTRAATDEIYSIFNQPLKAELQAPDDTESVYGSDYEEDDYTSVGETTGQISAAGSEFGDDDNVDNTRRSYHDMAAAKLQNETQADVTGVSEWSEFTGKHLPALDLQGREESGSRHSLPGAQHRTSVNHQDNNDNNEGQNNGSLSPDQTKGNVGRRRFVPVPPPDYNPPVGPYRDAAVTAQNRLPFMTPIIEQTETSLGCSTVLREKGCHYYKTPSKMASTPAIPEMDDNILSSPFQDFTQLNHAALRYPTEDGSPSRSAKKALASPLKSSFSLRTALSVARPIIDEKQCNPMDHELREKILKNISPPLQSYPGYFDRRTQVGGNVSGIKKFFKNNGGKGTKSSSSEKMAIPPILSFNGAARDYEIKRELGEGGYAPVYLAQSVDSPDTFSSDSEQEPNDKMRGFLMGRRPSRDVERKSLEAIKIETSPPSAWEFHMLRIARARLGSSAYHRDVDSIVQAHELHLFKDESILVEDFQNQGTLIDLINTVRNEQNGGDMGLDETVAMFFAVELFRVVEALHACGIIHGDLKGDNCLIRLGQSPVSSMDGDANTDSGTVHYSPTGAYGWRSKGLTLIDFGRAIDMLVFPASVQFVADWKIGSHECVEMKECRPWTYQIDLYGLANTIFIMLFGKYMEVIPVANGENGVALGIGGGSRKTYRIKESLKRYWEREIWSEVFDLCLNPTSAKWAEIERQNSPHSSPVSRFGSPASDSDADSMVDNNNKPLLPVVNSMRIVREKMEEWLVVNAGRKGLLSQLNRLEALISKKRGKRGSDKF